jgi:hypothetical protein
MKLLNFNVVFLANYNEGLSSLVRFIKYYQIYKSGIKHNLIICFKNFCDEKIIVEWKKVINKRIKYKSYFDDYKIDDYDWGSYRRIAKNNKNKEVFFPVDIERSKLTENQNLILLSIFSNLISEKKI